MFMFLYAAVGAAIGSIIVFQVLGCDAADAAGLGPSIVLGVIIGLFGLTGCGAGCCRGVQSQQAKIHHSAMVLTSASVSPHT